MWPLTCEEVQPPPPIAKKLSTLLNKSAKFNNYCVESISRTDLHEINIDFSHMYIKDQLLYTIVVSYLMYNMHRFTVVQAFSMFYVAQSAAQTSVSL